MSDIVIINPRFSRCRVQRRPISLSEPGCKIPILITGSIAGFMPGAFYAVYNASKAFLHSSTSWDCFAPATDLVSVCLRGASTSMAAIGMLDRKQPHGAIRPHVPLLALS